MTDWDSGLAWKNRRLLAGSGDWPTGVLAECERLDGEHPNWDIIWVSRLYQQGGRRPAFVAQWLGHERIYGGDLIGGGYGRRRPRVFGSTSHELVAQIAVMNTRIARHRAVRYWLVAAITGRRP